jgi:uncharacterized protein YktB (UPF0637 family)
LEPITSVKVITNKKKICRNHLKNCEYFKAELSSEALSEFFRKINEEKNEREKMNAKNEKQLMLMTMVVKSLVTKYFFSIIY